MYNTLWDLASVELHTKGGLRRTNQNGPWITKANEDERLRHPPQDGWPTWANFSTKW